MLNYRPDLKQNARILRTNMTDAEQRLWHHIRRKQILDVQVFRQRPIGEYIVDFHAPGAKLVIEIDGSQHMTNEALSYDSARSTFLESLGLCEIRFDNLQILNEIALVLETIHQLIEQRKSLPPCRPRGPLHGATVSPARSMLREFPAQPSL